MTSKNIVATIAAGLIAAQAVLPAAALAAGDSAGARTGSGSTEVTIQLVGGNAEAGGTSEPMIIPAPEGTDPSQLVDEEGNPDPNGSYIKNPLYNPDADGDGYGDNLAFSVPSAINFVATAKGELIGPSPEALYIENCSPFAIHTSSFWVEAKQGWTLVDGDVENVNTENALDFQFGPIQDQLDAFDYLSKRAVTTPSAWNMAPSTEDAPGAADRVELTTSGHIHNVALDIASESAPVATIHTYVSPGNAA